MNKVKIKNKSLFDDHQTIIDNDWLFEEGKVGNYSIEVPEDDFTSYVYKYKKDRDDDLSTLKTLYNDKRNIK